MSSEEESGKCSGKVREDALMKVKDCHNDGNLRHFLINDEDKLDNGEHKRYITIESISLK